MSHLFEEAPIGGLILKNRFVRSATWEGLADRDGGVTPQLTRFVTKLARNKIGLIITGFAFVTRDGQTCARQMAVWDDRFLPGLRQMSEAVHAAGGKIALQLVHGGRFSSEELTGERPRVPSADPLGEIYHALSAQEIAELVAAFASAALRAKNAGFDAVQLHAAHGFLLSEFLSPAFNHREDSYGVSLQNRARLLLEVVRAIRTAVGPDYPLLVKMNSEDFLEDGMTRVEAIAVARMLQHDSVDAIELSGGTPVSEEKIPARPGELASREQEAYYREAAMAFQRQLDIPLILVGGIRSFEVAEELVEHGAADFISLCRPLIGEPDLVKRWRAGDRRKSVCLSCNGCIGPALEGNGLQCVVLEPKAAH